MGAYKEEIFPETTEVLIDSKGMLKDSTRSPRARHTTYC